MKHRFNMRLLCLLVLGSLTFGCASALETMSEAYRAGGEGAVTGASTFLNIECARNPAQRQEFVTAINDRQAARGKLARAKAQDCDGDGASDF